jgi:hypothetical protein
MARFAVRAKGPLEALLRLIGLALVMGLAVYGFWKNSERPLERINAGAALADETASLSEDQRAHVRASPGHAPTLRRGAARAGDGRPPCAPEQDARRCTSGLRPPEASAGALPPLMAGARVRLQPPAFEEHFPFHFALGATGARACCSPWTCWKAACPPCTPPAAGTPQTQRPQTVATRI